MPTQSELLDGVLGAVTVHSPVSFSWFGKRTGDLPAKTQKSMSPATRRDYLTHHLQSRLYGDFYCRGFAAPPDEAPQRWSPPGLTPFVQALSAANVGTGSREPGWAVRAVNNGHVVVERDGLSLWIRREDAYAAPADTLAPGEERHVRFPKELLKLSPGFYMALGDEGLRLSPSSRIVRFYWNLRSDGAPRLLEAATRALNRAHVPFRLKVVNEPERFNRCDAGVLYVEQADYLGVARVVKRIYRDLVADLKPATPAFTKQLAPGLALAEDPPGSAESFGIQRCRLLAEGIVRAFERGIESLRERVDTVSECFSEEGLSLRRPYLNAGSTNEYRFTWP